MNNAEITCFKNAGNIPIDKNLKEILNALTVKRLRHIGDLFLLNGLSNIRKKELIQIIYDALTSEEELSKVIERFIDRELILLKKLINNNGFIKVNNSKIEDYYFLHMLGIVFLFEKGNSSYISITDDVYDTLKNMNLSKYNDIVKDNTKTYNLIRAMIEVYGVVSESDFANTYSYYYGETDYLDIPMNALYFCDRLDNISKLYTEGDSYFISNVLKDDYFKNELEDIINRQYEIKRKPIKLNELLKYTNYYYYEENESIIKFKRYLKENKMSDENIEEIIVNIVATFKISNRLLA